MDRKQAEVTAHPSQSPNIQLNDLIKFPPDFPCPELGWRVIGSVHGLICFRCRVDVPRFNVYIWNPSQSVVMRLPDFTRNYYTPHDSDLGFIFKFGFDPKFDDYKVVKVGVPYRAVEVYSMRKGTWKFISENVPLNRFPFERDNQGIAGGHDGHVYWLCYTDYGKYVILAFDLGNETFLEISLPDSICRPGDSDKILCFFHGKLCVIRHTYGICAKFEMWVMNERGVTDSWVKHTVLSRFTSNILPMGFTVNNEFLFTGKKYDSLALYDPDTFNVKHFECCHVYYKTKIVQYVDSLVWITPAKKHAWS